MTITVNKSTLIYQKVEIISKFNMHVTQTRRLLNWYNDKYNSLFETLSQFKKIT